MHAIGATLKTSTVILADDHPLVRRGVRSLFQPIPEFSIVAEAKDGFEAVELVERWSPGSTAWRSPGGPRSDLPGLGP